jgi:phytoene dehydrogenase-like protein
VRYDAAIIGAGPDGLAAAAWLARAGFRIIVVERSAHAGGRCVTSEFHPGFRASPFADELAPMPPEIFRSLDLARHGAVLTLAPALSPLGREAAARRRAMLRRILAGADTRARAFSFFKRRAPWPGQDWAARPLCDVAGAGAPGAFTMGRAVDSQQPGSALHLLAPRSGSGMTRGGLGMLGGALAAAAYAAGAELRFGAQVRAVCRSGSQVTGLALSDGTTIAARAILSTLDLRHSFFSLFAWTDLPPAFAARVSGFRMAAATARLLLALEAPPKGLQDAPLILDPAPAAALEAWRQGVIAPSPPLELRLVSAVDPSLAPPGKAVLTVTLGCIPYRLFDGAWTPQRRALLQTRALAAIQARFPDVVPLASRLIVPPDIEAALGLTDGDLDGGEIAADQMLEARPGPRTPVRGFYLAGPSCAAGPLGTCAGGLAAARAFLADHR